jgi:hypothetical protein
MSNDNWRARACRAIGHSASSVESLGGGGLPKGRTASQGWCARTLSYSPQGLKTCRAVTLRGPRLGVIATVSSENVNQRREAPRPFGVAEPPITNHLSLLLSVRERHRIQQELLILRPMLTHPFLTSVFPG